MIRRFDEGTADVSPAARESDQPGALPRKCKVSCIAIALDLAAKIVGDDLLQTLCGATRLPVEDDIAAGPMHRPKVTCLGLAVTGSKIADRRLVDLHIT